MRDNLGFLQLATGPLRGGYAWIAQDNDGTVSKIDPRTMREVARYSSVTCYSLPGGNPNACDGQGNGCCAVDSDPQWENRKLKKAEGPPQGVQRADNSPSRTTVDWNGDVFVANRAFAGQASVTRIAGDVSRCKDRNKNGRIDTSMDVNRDGRIDVNDPKEYFGIEDECILWTANHGGANAIGRPLALDPVANNAGPADVWAGEYTTGRIFRVDGNTGKIGDEVQLPPDCNPYGLAVDAAGYGWAPDLGPGELCYFDTRNRSNVGVARYPTWGKMAGYGITVDRDENVWVGKDVARYTPDRTNGFNNLGKGVWTRFGPTAGIGIASDSRSPNRYFVWSADGNNKVTRIPASDTPIPKQDATVSNTGWPAIDMPAYGVGVDTDQNIIGVPAGNVVYRAKVDALGNIMQPDVVASPGPGQRCPAGDRCDLGTHQYTYSDFTGFAARHFISTGTYSYIVPGRTVNGQSAETLWWSIRWSATTPPGTSVTVRARTGNTPLPDNGWGAWTASFFASPADLSPAGVLVPNGPAQNNAYYLQVEFTLTTTTPKASPTLRGFEIAFK